ncbi:MAG: transketolase C-terminal domain-containing protein, partial [Patescibacteria group bacterium]
LARSGIEARVLNMHTVKPLDTETIQHAARDTQALLTLEDHQVHGGLGSAVAEYVVQNHPQTSMKILGVSDTFGQSGNGEELLDYYGLGVNDIVDAAVQLMRHKQVLRATMNI